MSKTYIISQIFAILAILSLGSSYLCKNKRKILILCLLSSIFYGGHNYLLGATTGVAMNVISVISNIWLYINAKNQKSNSLTFLITICLLTVVLGMLSFQNIFSLIPIIASLLFTYSIWQNDVRVYRWIGLPTSFLWISYDIYLKSIFGTITEVILLGFKLVGIIKARRKREL